MPKPVVRTLLLLLAVAIVYWGWDGPPTLDKGIPEPSPVPVAQHEAPSAPRHPLSSAAETLRQVRQIKASRDAPVWTATRTLTAEQNAEAHWRKHRREFPEYRSAEEYIEGAHRFLRGPPEGTQTKTRPNGDRLLYHPASNTFAVQAKNGAPRTMFRPNNGQRYWSRQ